jgi:hypothetical protein
MHSYEYTRQDSLTLRQFPPLHCGELSKTFAGRQVRAIEINTKGGNLQNLDIER